MKNWWYSDKSKNCSKCETRGFNFGKDFDREWDRVQNTQGLGAYDAIPSAMKNSNDWERCDCTK